MEFIILVGAAAYRVSGDPSVAPAAQALPAAVREAEEELAGIRRLAELYVFATGKTAEDADTAVFARNISGQIHPDRLIAEGESVFVDSGSQSAPRIQLTRDDFKSIFSLFTNEGTGSILGGGEYSLGYALGLLAAAVNILTNPFSTEPEMERFRENMATVLEKSKTENFVSFEKPGDILGLTQTSLRTVLDLYSGMADRLKEFAGGAYSASEQGDSLIVFSGRAANDSRFFTVLLHLVRLCQITELNLRNCLLMDPLPDEALDILSRCRITRLVPPFCGSSCQYLFLTSDSDSDLQSEIWHDLTEVGWFSRRGDWLRMDDFNKISGVPETRFFKNLVRPAVRPENFSVLEFLSISGDRYGDFSRDQMACLEKSTNLRALHVRLCRNVLALSFLLKMTRLEALWLENLDSAALPGHVFASLSKLSRLQISWSQLEELPTEIGQLRELERLVLTNNLSLASLPDSLCNCLKLLFLDLCNNCLRSLPTRLGSLAYLDISDNQSPELLAVVPNYTGLRTLKADNNLIYYMPANFGNLRSLRVLSLESNRIFELPPGMAGLHVLSSLYLSCNYLTSLPPFMVHFRYLRALSLNRNNFAALPSFVREMKRNNRFLNLYLAENPLQRDDSHGKLGLKTLQSVFGSYIMS